ncbi:MAG: hypothetical protein EOO12_01960 [Chitinophagaceae bacterium]|nr:MAG: hypothetical protein EOO12_01960 [Chitinophagaceae bacterium]
MTSKLGFYRLRNAELIRYLTQVMTLMATAGDSPEPLRQAVAALQARLDALNEQFKKDPMSEHAEALLLAEEERDDAVRGLYRYCDAFTYLRDPALSGAGKLLVNTIEVYGTGNEIAGHPNKIETTELESLLADLAKPAPAAAVALLRADHFTTPMAEANSRYEGLFLQDRTGGNNPEGTAAMLKLRSAAAADYDLFVRKLSGAYEMEGAGKWGDLVLKMNALTEEYRQTVNQRAARAKAASGTSATGA